MKKSIKTVVAVLTAFFILMMCTAPVFSAENTVDYSRFGDADGDGKIRAGDARILLRCSVELEKISEKILKYCDLDKD